MKKLFFISLIFFNINLYSQSTFKKFFELSSPEKWWVVFHPFKAKKAYHISEKTLKITDSISNTEIIGNDFNGGKLDAFKHSFWMAYLTRNIGKRAALKLGEAHEKGNYQSFKKNKKEDGYVHDKISSEMDIYNNEIGANIAIQNPESTLTDLENLIIKAINQGKMKVIKKDSTGNFLTCEGVIIPVDSLKGKWENEKCLIYSKL
ncbi:MAG: hypothetical protein ABFR05_05625 [Bacteroidota bacterium]